MRRVIAGLFMSLDGVVEGPGYGDDFERAGWTMPYFDNEIGQVIAENTARSDILLLGRVTYHTFERTFASQTDEMAAQMNNFPKVVVSTSLKSADWSNSTLVSDSVVAEISRLKQQPGKDITISGSITLVQSLMKHNLVDEFSLLVYPVVVGSGRRLFDDTNQTNLKLVKAAPLNSGVVHLTYETATAS